MDVKELIFEFIKFINNKKVDNLVSAMDDSSIRFNEYERELVMDPDSWVFEEQIEDNQFKYDCYPYDGHLKCYVFIKNDTVDNINLDIE